MNEPAVTIQIVVFNGERYLRQCLSAVQAQDYPNLQVLILDNASTDATTHIVHNEFPEFRLISSETNLGMWPGQERLMAESKSEYILVLSVDVLLAPDFITKAVAACQANPSIGALQPKVYQYTLGKEPERKIIDTCGFTLTRSRKVVNIGHGQTDHGQFSAHDIFGVEGAVPFFRRDALEDCRIDGELIDKSYFWYGDDLDLAWRMTLLGHRQRFVPDVVAWHDRSTTKAAAGLPVFGQLRRLGDRRHIPLLKRRLDWSNVRFTIIKNDYIINILRDAPYWLARELTVLGYTILFEPKVLAETGRFLRLLPSALRWRRKIMARAKTSPGSIHRYFI